MRRALGLIGFVVLLGCTAISEQEAPLAVASEPRNAPLRRFSFMTLDGRIVSSGGYRGRMTVIAMVATYDAASQAQTKFLETVYRRHTPRINALLLVLEPPEHLPLVEAYASSLSLSYDVAIADAATIAGKGAFPGLHHVPSLVLLDREGREVWRTLGLVEAEGLSEAIADHDDRAF